MNILKAHVSPIQAGCCVPVIQDQAGGKASGGCCG
jgi:hypothetical protein